MARNKGALNLDHHIVRLLGKHSGLTAAALWQRINKLCRPCTLQGVYHELRKLQGRGSVVKSGQMFSLSLLWALDLVQFADEVYRNCVASAARMDLLPEPGQKKRWRFTKLLRMDALYVQLTLLLLKEVKEGAVFEWCPHPWFMLVQQEFEERFKRALEKSGRDIYCIIGGRGRLDNLWIRSRPSPTIRYNNQVSPFDDRRTEYFTVAGQYVLTAKLAREAADGIDHYFRKARSLRDVDYREIREFIDRSWTLSVTLENNPGKARKIRRQFESSAAFTADK